MRGPTGGAAPAVRFLREGWGCGARDRVGSAPREGMPRRGGTTRGGAAGERSGDAPEPIAPSSLDRARRSAGRRDARRSRARRVRAGLVARPGPTRALEGGWAGRGSGSERPEPLPGDDQGGNQEPEQALDQEEQESDRTEAPAPSKPPALPSCRRRRGRSGVASWCDRVGWSWAALPHETTSQPCESSRCDRRRSSLRTCSPLRRLARRARATIR